MTQQLACPLTRGERILVALDGSESSDAALDQAISLGQICNSTIFALNVVDLLPGQLAVAPALTEKLSEESRVILEKAQAKIEENGITCKTIIHIGGQPDEYIIQEAKAKEVDLIVMGTNGRTGLKKLLIGSVVQKVLGHAPCAVMVVPAFVD